MEHFALDALLQLPSVPTQIDRVDDFCHSGALKPEQLPATAPLRLSGIFRLPIRTPIPIEGDIGLRYALPIMGLATLTQGKPIIIIQYLHRNTI